MALMEESAGALPWDPLREQDWHCLGVLGDETVMEDGGLWDGAGDGVVGQGTVHHGYDGLEIDESGMPSKASSQFSPMTIDAQFDCFWDNFPGHGLDAGAQDEGRNPASHTKHEVESTPEGPGASAQPAGKSRPSEAAPHAAGPQPQHDCKEAAMANGGRAHQMARSHAVPPLGDGVFMGMPPHMLGGTEALAGTPMHGPAQQGAMPTALGDGTYQIRVKDKDMLLLPLVMVAITDGSLMPDTPAHMRRVLEQTQRRVSKEHLTAVQVRASDGSLVDLKVRVVPVASGEAVAINDYIATHPSQVPAPFVVLHSNLDVGVALEAGGALDPAVASGAERLRKKIKTHALKMLREVMSDGKGCRVSADCLAGMHGAMAALPHLRYLLDQKMTAIADDGVLAPGAPGPRWLLVVPTKKPRAPRESDGSKAAPTLHLPLSISGATSLSVPGLATAPATARAAPPGRPGAGVLHAHINGGAGRSSSLGSTNPTQPTTPSGLGDLEPALPGQVNRALLRAKRALLRAKACCSSAALRGRET